MNCNTTHYRANSSSVPGDPTVEPKRGRYDNELGRFRYDVVLAFDEEAAAPEPRWLDWGRDVPDLDALRRLLAGGGEPALGVRGIPNRRTLPHVAAAARLFGEETPAAPGDGVDPDDVRELARELAWTCAESWADGRPDGGFDAVFRRGDARESGRPPGAGTRPPRQRPWAEYANRPLRGRLLRELVPELRRHVAASLPEHMVPSAFVVLDSFPVTPNGKLDRRALPAPDSLRLELAQSFEAPREGAERDLAAVWARVLNLERVGSRDNFFELGGDSILAIHVVAAARESGWHVRARDLFEHPTVAALARVARSAPAGRAEQGLLAGPVPLSPIQRWLLEQDLADPHHFNQTLLLALPERLEPAALQAALLAVVGQHDALRLRLRRGPSGWEQDFGPLPAEVPLEVHDLSALPEEERRRRLESAGSRLQAGLDLGSGLLLAAALFRAATGDSDALLLTVHHLGVDTVSWSPLLADLRRALEPVVGDAPAPLPPKTSSFAAWSAALATAAASQQIALQARHWLQLPWQQVRPLPVDRPGGANTAAAARTLEVALEAGPTRALLHELPAALGADMNALLLTALARAVSEWTGHGHVLLELEGHGREELAPGLDVSRTVGWFTTIHPVLLTVERGADITATLKEVQANLAASPDHGRPFGLARFLSPDAALAGSLAALPRAGILFNYLGQLDRALGAESGFTRLALPVGPSRSPRGRRAHLLEVDAGVHDARLRARWAFGGELHDERTVAGVARRFVAELEALVAACRTAGRSPPVARGLERFGWSSEDIEDVLSDLDERS